MPVWHEATKALRASGKLTVIGIAQEQHPDRCRLFAQWKGIDWPILWDPFNMTGSRVVPRFFLIDEHGVVQSLRATKRSLDEFLAASYPPVDAKDPPREPVQRLVQLRSAKKGSPGHAYYEALSTLLWAPDGGRANAIAQIEKYARLNPKDAAARWRLGVAHRLRHDSARREPGDFQKALRSWRAGLDLDPRQYIYRRRIQQYGPKLDKPYPFYDWVADAQRAIRARGEEPVALVAPLSEAERAARGSADPAVEGRREPDAKQKIEPAHGLLEVESAAAWHTSAKHPTKLRVHLLINPRKGLRWEPDAGPMSVWIRPPKGAVLPRQLLDGRPKSATASVAFDFELELRQAGVPSSLRGYALFYACKDETGECKYLRHDFEITLPERR